MSVLRIKKRQGDAGRVFRAIDAVCDSLNKVPSFTGKARFIDKVLKARIYAHNLHWNLKHDPEIRCFIEIERVLARNQELRQRIRILEAANRAKPRRQEKMWSRKLCLD